MAEKQEYIKGWDLTGFGTKEAPEAPRPDAEWPLEKGTAWVYRGKGNQKLTKPVILSDGFHAGATDIDEMWQGLERGAYPFISEMRQRGYDMVILGYDDCTASMLSNAEVARACIDKAIKEREGTAPLAVGGFSMGGIITRYILAKMEQEARSGGKGHQADTYICYDSPHLGAWIPIAIQAMALTLFDTESREMIISDAARQLLWRHLPRVTGAPAEDPKRTAFLGELATVGNWPMQLHKIGVANGKGQGTNGITPGALALTGDSGVVSGVKLWTQRPGNDQEVAKVQLFGAVTQKTSGMPEADGAHGGKLAGFKLARDGMVEAGFEATCNVEDHGFVPTGSAIAITSKMDLWTGNMSASVLNAVSELDEFKCASQNEAHTLMTQELGGWIIDRLDRRRR
jgi:Putative serine esterase (DUF676)